jgi:hypothetical protein
MHEVIDHRRELRAPSRSLSVALIPTVGRIFILHGGLMSRYHPDGGSRHEGSFMDAKGRFSAARDVCELLHFEKHAGKAAYSHP